MEKEMKKETHLEVLAPAGSMDALVAAVRCGADAVYLAGTVFGMRAFAGNFSPEELPEETVTLPQRKRRKRNKYLKA